MHTSVLLGPMLETFTTFFDALFLPLGDFISEHIGSLGWLVDLLERSNLGDNILEASLGSLLLGAGLLTVLVIAIIYYFLP